MFWTYIIEVGVRLIGAWIGFTKNKSEAQKWMKEAATTLRKKRLVRQKFLVEQDKDSDEYLNTKLDEVNSPKQGDENDDSNT